MKDFIEIKGARQHNLKNINLSIPKNKLVVFSGVSGSGKSSLAFDTIYAEGQRRYVESLSSYARQFLGISSKPDVDFIEGLSPSISIDQKSASHNPRSTVGTITEIYDYLRLLYARIGHPHCPVCKREISQLTAEQITDKTLEIIANTKAAKNKPIFLYLLSPVVQGKKGEFSSLLNNIRAKGYIQARIDGKIYDLSADLFLLKNNKHTIEIVVDKFTYLKSKFSASSTIANLKSRILDSVRASLNLSDGLVILTVIEEASFTFPTNPTKFVDFLFSQRFSCPYDNLSLTEIEPRTFSFNSPYGACKECSGIGALLKINPDFVINNDLSLDEGAILPFAQHLDKDTWYTRLLKTVCEKYEINTKIPVSKLSPQKINILLNGTGQELHEVSGFNRFGRQTSIVEQFKGIISDLEKKYRETESDYVRRELEKFMYLLTCPICNGARLKIQALSITIDKLSIADVSKLTIDKAYVWISNLLEKKIDLSTREYTIARQILSEINSRLHFLISVGLEYLTLDRSAHSLAGGEAQRIRLASQIGSGLSGVLYVLDEPSIGLHSRDNYKLINTLKKLRDLGNTVIVVEHDRDTIKSADMIVDFGPNAGELGGHVVAQGDYNDIINNPKSLTGKYLSGKKNINFSYISIPQSTETLTVLGCGENNLKNIDVSIPLCKLVCITGVSGSGKSSFLETTLYHLLASKLNRFHRQPPGKYTRLKGIEFLHRVVLIDQSPIGRTPRSNPATYINAFTYIREIFASTQAAKALGFTPGHFSFNVRGGRCEQCEGEGQIKIEMQFMSDIYITCEACKGKRYNNTTLEILYKDKNIADILAMTVSQACEFFTAFPSLFNKLNTLKAVGLSYMRLGQSATTLSGGEAQRVKLSYELAKSSTQKTIYLLDEPTTGLHFADLEKLLYVLKMLVNRGNTVVVIEHNLDIIKNSDWIIDLGPEGGEKGGTIVASGTPQDVAKTDNSYTGQFLKKIL